MHLIEPTAVCSLPLSCKRTDSFPVWLSPHDLRTAWTLISQNDFHFPTFHSLAASYLRPNMMAIVHFQLQDPSAHHAAGSISPSLWMWQGLETLHRSKETHWHITSGLYKQMKN